jgi:uncharacterized protein (TIGR02996 family)
MTHDDAFLLAILEDPDDDTPRLVYADWLEERGNPRGEFIRIQCQLANLPENDRKRNPLEERSVQLLQQHRSDWLGRLRSLAFVWGFRRGFPEEATIAARSFLQDASTIFKLAPLRLLRLVGTAAVLSRIVACRNLRRLAALHFTDNGLGDAGIAVLADSPHLQRLATLRLRNNHIHDAGAESIAASTHLSGLTTLDLSGNQISDAGVMALAGSANLSGLTTLLLSDNQIGNAGAEALAASTHLTQLRKLVLGNGGRLGGNSIAPKQRQLLRERFGSRVCTF